MKKYLIMASLMAATTLPAAAKTIADVTLSPSLDTQGQPLTLQGAGIRSKFFMDLYVGSLYSSAADISADQVLSGDDLNAIRLNIVSGLITSDKMIDTIEAGFKKAAKGDYDNLKPQIERFIAVFNQPIEEGDQFTLVSIPGTGVEAFKNGELLTLVEGEQFRTTLFGIWLGDDPADDDLKQEMLGN